MGSARTSRFPRAEKKQLPLVQAHAFDHYLTGSCDGTFPVGDSRQSFRCPLCFAWLPVGSFTIDHVPPSGEQSRFGPAWMTVLSCSCNSDAGGRYEADASDAVRTDWFGEDRCKVHGTVDVDGGFDSEFMRRAEPVDLTDIKTAYLLAFGLLGYSWCSTPRLHGLRHCLTARARLDPADALVTCGLSSKAFPERSVVEVGSPVPMILVIGPAHAVTVALPTDRTPDVRLAAALASESAVKARVHPWPLTVRKTAEALGVLDQFMKPEQAWDNGMTFHLDRCEEPHTETVSFGRGVTRRLNRRIASSGVL